MAKKGTNKQYFVYVKGLKKKVAVTEAVFHAYYDEPDRLRHREYYHHRCGCPRRKWWLCDEDCKMCGFKIEGDIRSLDEPRTSNSGEEYTLFDVTPAQQPETADIAVNNLILQQLFKRFKELLPEAQNLSIEDLASLSDTALAKAIGLPRTTWLSKRKKATSHLKNEYPDALLK